MMPYDIISFTTWNRVRSPPEFRIVQENKRLIRLGDPRMDANNFARARRRRPDRIESFVVQNLRARPLPVAIWTAKNVRIHIGTTSRRFLRANHSCA